MASVDGAMTINPIVLASRHKTTTAMRHRVNRTSTRALIAAAFPEGRGPRPWGDRTGYIPGLALRTGATRRDRSPTTDLANPGTTQLAHRTLATTTHTAVRPRVHDGCARRDGRRLLVGGGVGLGVVRRRLDLLGHRLGPVAFAIGALGEHAGHADEHGSDQAADHGVDGTGVS